MDFYAILDQVIALLQQRGKASYRALQLQFKLDDASLDVLKEELIKVHELARRCSCGRVTRPLPRQCLPTCSDTTTLCCPGTAVPSSSGGGTTATDGHVL